MNIDIVTSYLDRDEAIERLIKPALNNFGGWQNYNVGALADMVLIEDVRGWHIRSDAADASREDVEGLLRSYRVYHSGRDLVHDPVTSELNRMLDETPPEIAADLAGLRRQVANLQASVEKLLAQQVHGGPQQFSHHGLVRIDVTFDANLPADTGIDDIVLASVADLATVRQVILDQAEDNPDLSITQVDFDLTHLYPND